MRCLGAMHWLCGGRLQLAQAGHDRDRPVGPDPMGPWSHFRLDFLYEGLFPVIFILATYLKPRLFCSKVYTNSFFCSNHIPHSNTSYIHSIYYIWIWDNGFLCFFHFSSTIWAAYSGQYPFLKTSDRISPDWLKSSWIKLKSCFTLVKEAYVTCIR